MKTAQDFWAVFFREFETPKRRSNRHLRYGIPAQLGNALRFKGVAELPENSSEYLSESNGESTLLSFVVHLWKEETNSEELHISWRGHITPVPNGVRLYFTDVSQIPELIIAHLNLQK
jgi:hypothetical protein